MKKTKALGRGLGALIGRKNLEDPDDSAQKQAMSKEFYGSLLKKYVQGGRKDKTLEGLMSDVRVHLNISEEEHQHLIQTLEKREKSAPVERSDEVWNELQQEMKGELSQLFNEFRESEEKMEKKKDHDISSKEPIALPERSINVVKGSGEGTIEAPPPKDMEQTPPEEQAEDWEKDLFDYDNIEEKDEARSEPIQLGGEAEDLDNVPEAEVLEEVGSVDEDDDESGDSSDLRRANESIDSSNLREGIRSESVGSDEEDDESGDSSYLRDVNESVDSSNLQGSGLEESIRSESVGSDEEEVPEMDVIPMPPPMPEPVKKGMDIVYDEEIPLEEMEELEETLEDVKEEEKTLEDIHEPEQKPREKKGTIGDLRIMMDEDRIEEALKLSEKLMEEDEYSYEVLNERGVLLYHTGDINGSIKCYERALKLNPESLEAVVNYATLLAGKGEIDRSLSLLSDAVEKNPYSEEAWNNKAVVLAHIGRNREALECLDQSVRINDRSVETWFNTAVILEKLEEYGPAYECYTRILDLEPDHGTARKGQEYCRMHK